MLVENVNDMQIKASISSTKAYRKRLKSFGDIHWVEVEVKSIPDGFRYFYHGPRDIIKEITPEQLTQLLEKDVGERF